MSPKKLGLCKPIICFLGSNNTIIKGYKLITFKVKEFFVHNNPEAEA